MPARNTSCSDELSAGRMPMCQYHRTKVSVRADRYSCGSQKRASVDDTEERSVIHGPGRSAESPSKRSSCGHGNRIMALQPGGLPRIFPSEQRGRVNFLSDWTRSPLRRRKEKSVSVKSGVKPRQKGGKPAVGKVASGSARQSNYSSARPGTRPACFSGLVPRRADS